MSSVSIVQLIRVLSEAKEKKDFDDLIKKYISFPPDLSESSREKYFEKVRREVVDLMRKQKEILDRNKESLDGPRALAMRLLRDTTCMFLSGDKPCGKKCDRVFLNQDIMLCQECELRYQNLKKNIYAKYGSNSSNADISLNKTTILLNERITDIVLLDIKLQVGLPVKTSADSSDAELIFEPVNKKNKPN
jgi:hypothetical protein